jgi:hypothetical protein
LVVSDGAPGLIKAIDELWPAADRGRCAVHKLRNVVAKLPKRPGLRDEIKDKYWATLDDATDPVDGYRHTQRHLAVTWRAVGPLRSRGRSCRRSLAVS